MKFVGEIILLCLVISGICTAHQYGDLVPCVEEHGKFMCVCSLDGQYTDCTRLNISYMPLIPQTTIRLNISRNSFTHLSVNMLMNITNRNLTLFDMSLNQIQAIDRGFFIAFPFLRQLYMSNNRLNYEVLMETFPGISKTIEELYLNNLTFPPKLGDSFFQPLNGSDLSFVQLNYNHIKKFYAGETFTYLSKLKSLDLSMNYLDTVILNYSTSLNSLYLSYNDLTYFPEFCVNKTNSFFPSLEKLFIDRNCLNTLEDLKLNCLEKLEHLNISQIRINTLHTGIFSKMRKLRRLALDNIASFVAIQPYAFKSESLKYISIADNQLQFKSDKISVESVFLGCPQLSGLDISGNFLGHLNESDWQIMLEPIPNLYFLNASVDGLRFLPKALPIILKNLKEFHVAYNTIHHIPHNYFEPLKNLRHLSMDLNQFTSFSETDIPKNLTSLNLIQNPYICDCDIVWFKNFMERNKGIMMYYPEQYTCRAKGIPVADFHIDMKDCSVSYLSGLITKSSCYLVIFLIVLYSVIYKFRWRLRYVLYLLNYHKRNINSSCENSDIQHDIFITCAKSDFSFVLRSIVRKLETEEHLRIYITERDLLPGQPKIQRTLDHLDSSKFFMICLSNYCCLDQYWEFETTMAIQKSAYDHTDNLIPVILEEISSENMTQVHSYLLRNMNYIIWDENEDTENLFWRKLRSRLESN